MAIYPCPEHFIVRPGIGTREKVIVPLIAVDQLPDWIQLAGVPRQLDVDQASGMVNLGLVTGDGFSAYEVRLRIDKIRAIMSGSARHEKEEEHLAPSDSVSEKTSMPEEDSVEEGPTLGSQNQTKKPGLKERQDKILRHTEKYTVKASEGVQKTTETEIPPAVHEKRAWDDDSEGSFSNTVTAGPEKQEKASKQQHEGKADASVKKPPTEPTLSASRHNTAVDATVEKPVQEDKPIRPHLTEEMIESRSSHVVVPRVKDKFFGTNPNTLYCRHWCHHGTCKWGWQCRYQHRMPRNSEGLREVGLKDFPTWYLLMMAGGGFPNIGGGQSHGLGGSHRGMDIGVNAMQPLTQQPTASTLNKNTDSLLLAPSGPGPNPANALLYANEQTQTNSGPSHASPMELRLIQGRMSALLAGSNAMSNRQKLRQIREMREIFLRSNALEQYNNSSSNAAANLLGLGSTRHEHHHFGRANLHTNASVAANAAELRAANQRQALREMERGVLIPREYSAEEKRAWPFNELEGRLSLVSSSAGEDEGVASQTVVREGKLVDIE